MDDSQSLLEAQNHPLTKKRVRFSNIVTVYRDVSFSQKNSASSLVSEPILVPLQQKLGKPEDNKNACPFISIALLLAFLLFLFILFVILIRRMLLMEIEHQSPQYSSHVYSSR